MKSKKVFFAIAATLFSAMLFTGCACDRTPPPDDTPPDDTPPVVNPESKPVTDYFSSTLKTKYYITNNTLLDQAGTPRSFTNLVERQIDVLANDILYRLVAVYGAGTEGLTTETGKYGEPAFGLTDPLTGKVYTNAEVNTWDSSSPSTGKALISNYDLIKLPYTADFDTALYKYLNGTTVMSDNSKLNEAVSYANELYTGKWSKNNIIYLTWYFNNTNAINGGYYWDDNAYLGRGGFVADLGFNEDLRWNWNYNRLDIDVNSSATDVYNEYKDEYLSALKTAIANILVSGSSSGKTYSAAVNEINKLGFSAADKTNIKNFVLNEMIGSNLISEDNNRKPNVITLSSDTQLTEEEHYYKAYSLLVPEIINRAFENTFSGTTVSFWLNAEKTVLSTETNLNINSLTNKNFTTIKLMANANTPVTMLKFSISGIELSNLTLTYSLYRNATTAIPGAVNKTITTTSSGNFVLDFNAYKSYTFASGGYIEIKFTNTSNSNFNINLTGYYDKAYELVNQS